MSTGFSFNIPKKKTLVKVVRSKANDLPTLSNFVMSIQRPIEAQGGFIDEATSRHTIKKEEILPKTVEEVYHNIKRVANNPSGRGNRVYNQQQVKKIAENLGILNSENKNAGKAQLVSIIRQHVLSRYNLTEKDIPKDSHLKEAFSFAPGFSKRRR